jgi:3-phenylpropionate/trans-cinnamate dioxygenase ferredoxin component
MQETAMQETAMPEARLCAVDDLKFGEVRQFKVGKTKIALVRLDDGWYAVGDTCTHQKISLSEGEVHAETKEIECWKHGSKFSLVDGSPHALPATKPTPVYEVRIDGDDVMVVI